MLQHTLSADASEFTGTYSGIAEVREDVNTELRAVIAERKQGAYTVKARYGELWDVIEAYVMNKGKRVRPYLTVIGYELYGGVEYEKILKVAAAHEILNQALLIHDDIIDRDFVRYGVPNIAGYLYEYYKSQRNYDDEQSRHYANSAALLAGDLCIAEAFILIRKSGFSAEQIVSLLDLLYEAIFVVAGGEFLDSETYGLPIESSDPLIIAHLKTAVYSIIVPMLCGASVAGADEVEIAKLREFGTKLGVAYQLVDDMLGVFGNEDVTGKTVIGDLREGKHTYIMQQTWRHASEQDVKVLTKLFGKPSLTNSEADIIREIIARTGAKRACEKQIGVLMDEAGSIIDSLGVPHEGKRVLHEFCDMLTKRES